VTLFGCGGGTDGAETSTTGEPQQAEHHPSHPPGVKVCPKGSPESRTIPAHIDGHRDAGDITTAVIFTANGWVARDCHGTTFVYAGSAGWEDSMGLAYIFRLGRSKQFGGGFIALPGSGALRITRAPLGPAVITSAQRRGDIQFTSEGGISGTIHLQDNSATLSTGEVIPAVPDVRSIWSG
jgi:hypothetical protein